MQKNAFALLPFYFFTSSLKTCCCYAEAQHIKKIRGKNSEEKREGFFCLILFDAPSPIFHRVRKVF
jgi:hypothetical protein